MEITVNQKICYTYSMAHAPVVDGSAFYKFKNFV